MCLPYIIVESIPSPKPKPTKPSPKLAVPTRQPPASCPSPVLIEPRAPRPAPYVAREYNTELRYPVPVACVGREWVAVPVGAQRRGDTGGGERRRRSSSSSGSSGVSVKSFKEVKRKVGVLWEKVAGLEKEKERRLVEKEVREAVERERKEREGREREGRQERERRERVEMLESLRERRSREEGIRWDDGRRRGPWHGNEQMWRRW